MLSTRLTSRGYRVAVVVSTLFSFLAIVGISDLHAADEKAAAKPQPAPAEWVNVSDALFKQIGVDEKAPVFVRRCVGMLVTPTGDLFVLAGKSNGVCVSKDHGATWTAIDPKITGRCESGFGFSIAYPYDERFAFFTIDGTGGITLDGGKTWRPFGRFLRMLEYADPDWKTADPATIFGLTHEPFFTVVSTSKGQDWRQLYKDEESPKEAQKSLKLLHLGMINPTTFVRAQADKPGIALSTDAGKTWAEVAKFQVIGRRPVHFGDKTYWTTTEGVIVTSNGKDWSLVGKPLENATFGPYFGEKETDMMVVTEKGFQITRDGAKTWKQVAPFHIPPDGITKTFQKNGGFCYFGWDPNANFIYASQLGGSCHRLKVVGP